MQQGINAVKNHPLAIQAQVIAELSGLRSKFITLEYHCLQFENCTKDRKPDA